MNIGLLQGNNYSALVRKTIGEEKTTNVAQLSEAEKLENFKREIWNEIDSMPWRCDISIHISDEAFERMMNENDFKDRILNVIREDASVSGIKGGGTIINVDESGYSGFSWMEGYPKEASTGMSEHSKHSFYHKKVSYTQDYTELWEERRNKKEVQREKLDDAYEEQLYLKRYWERKERAAVAYEAAMMIEE